MPTTDVATAILDRIRAGGGRITPARRAILAELVGGAHHRTAAELAEAVQARLPDVHESTVYRFLDALTDLGVVEHVHLGHGPAVYHLVDSAHHHLLCETCGSVIEVPRSLLDGVARRVRDRYGFRLRPRHFALVGRCGSCPA